MTRSFTYEALPMRVTFGAGALRRLPDEVAALGLTRVLVLCSPGQAALGKLVADALGERAAGVLAEARMHVPIEVAHDARRRAARRAPTAASRSAAARRSAWAKPLRWNTICLSSPFPPPTPDPK